MKLQNLVKILLVLAGGVYVIYRSRDELSRMADDSLTLFGFVLLIGLLALAIGRVLRA